MIGHGAAAHRNAAGGAQPHKCFVFYGAGRQTGHVPCRGIVTLLIQTVGICKGGTGHAQLRRLAVHLRHKALQTAAVVRQSQRRIVAGAQQQTVQKLLHRHPVAGLQIHGGALRYVLLGHCDHIPQTATLQHHQGRHQLGGAGNEHLPVGILFVQDLPRIAVHENGRCSGSIRRPRRGQAQQHDCRHCRQDSLVHRITLFPQVILFYSVRSSLFPLFSCR